MRLKTRTALLASDWVHHREVVYGVIKDRLAFRRDWDALHTDCAREAA
ncbi:MAG: hypothetical protein ACRCYU_12030 [Nocardioides sp.]